MCAVLIGYLCKCMLLHCQWASTDLSVGLGYLKFLAPPEKVLRWLEDKLNLLAIVPHYVSVDQKTYGRFGVLPTTGPAGSAPITLVGSTQRLGP